MEKEMLPGIVAEFELVYVDGVMTTLVRPIPPQTLRTFTCEWCAETHPTRRGDGRRNNDCPSCGHPR